MHQKGRKKLKRQEKKQSFDMEASSEAGGNGGEALAKDAMPALYKQLTDITKEIRELKEETKNDITALDTSFKQDFASFKEDVHNRLKGKQRLTTGTEEKSK